MFQQSDTILRWTFHIAEICMTNFPGKLSSIHGIFVLGQCGEAGKDDQYSAKIQNGACQSSRIGVTRGIAQSARLLAASVSHLHTSRARSAKIGRFILIFWSDFLDQLGTRKKEKKEKGLVFGCVGTDFCK